MDDIVTLGSGDQVHIFTFGAGNDTILDFRSRYFTSSLDGAQEVPPVVTAATGSADLVLNGRRTILSIDLSVTGLSGDSFGHVHRAPAGVDGPIVFELSLPTGTTYNNVINTWTTVEPEVANLIAGGLYLNVHTAANPGGEIRGQILPVPGDTGDDRIDVTGINAGSLTALLHAIDDSSGSARLTVFQNGVADSLTLAGLLEADLVAADFVFAGAINQSLGGTAGADTIFCAGGDDSASGGSGNDLLLGEDGRDRLNGGAGSDDLVGGAGKDRLTGGTGRDDFIFDLATDSRKGSARDVILDFRRGDDIDLSAIDAKSGTGNQKFKFIGEQGFHGRKGELHYIDKAGAKVIVEGDINGDGRADFQIEVRGLENLTRGDFIL